jgi:hypothetical protein
VPKLPGMRPGLHRLELRAGRISTAPFAIVVLAVLCLIGCAADPPPGGTPGPITQADAVRIATERWSGAYPSVSHVVATLDRDEWVVKAESHDAERGEIVLVTRLDLYGNWINDGSHKKEQN